MKLETNKHQRSKAHSYKKSCHTQHLKQFECCPAMYKSNITNTHYSSSSKSLDLLLHYFHLFFTIFSPMQLIVTSYHAFKRQSFCWVEFTMLTLLGECPSLFSEHWVDASLLSHSWPEGLVTQPGPIVLQHRSMT